MTSYRLIPSLAFSRLGAAYYIHDRGLMKERVIVVPTQRISEPAYRALVTVEAHLAERGASSRDELGALFAGQPQQQQAVEGLFTAGYLEPAPTGKASSSAVPAGPDVEAHEFLRGGLGHYLHPSSLFHVPTDIADSEADVSLVGVAVASRPVSQGTIAGPDYLRMLSQRVASWFDVYERGIYAGQGCVGSLPPTLARGLVIQDAGNVGTGIESVRELFERLDEIVARVFDEPGLPTLFVGGDHAISFPIVDAFVRRCPDLCLLHFDAHHDIFYDRRVGFDHATVVRALLLHSGLRDVHSFGLRAGVEAHTPGLDAFAQSPEQAARLHPWSLMETRRMIADPEAFRALLRSACAGRPCYLTIDLDVLSAEAIGGRVSTPAGPGLEWHELLEAVHIIFDECTVLGADLVELDPGGGSSSEQPRELVTLALSLLERLARHRSGSG